MPTKNAEEKLIERIVNSIFDALRMYPNMFCDATSVNALLCDVISETDEIEFISRCGYSLYDDANPFGEFYYLKILDKIDKMMSNTYVDNDEIGSIIFQEISQGKTGQVRRFFAQLLVRTLELKGCPTKVFRWDNCPVCGGSILSYEDKCSSCGVPLDSYESIESKLISAKESLQSIKKTDWTRLERIKNDLLYPFKPQGSFYALKTEIDKIIADKEKEWNAEEQRKKDEEQRRVDLQRQEADAKERIARIEKEKRRKRVRRAVLSVILCLVLLVSGGLVYTGLTYWKPLAELKYNFSTLGDNKYEITGLKGENVSDLNIRSLLPKLLFQVDKEVTSIADNAFEYNETIKYVHLPATLNQIGTFAFCGCTSLQNVYLNSPKPPIIDTTSFLNTDCVFYVPVANYEAYLSADIWKDFSDKIFPDYSNDYEHGTIVFYTDGGTAVDVIEKHELNTVFQCDAVSTKEGYSFDGWFLNPMDESTEFIVGETIIQKSIKLYAKWSLADFKITFDYNGGEGDTNYIFVTYTHEVGELPKAAREGYSFDGWYYGDQLFANDTIVEFSSDIILNAHWLANSYNVVFDFQGGTQTLDKKTVVFDAPYGELPSSHKDGYILSGWYYNDTLIKSDTLVKVSSEHELTAHWEPIAYSIKFDSNGGELETDSIDCLYGEEYDVPKPSKRGYTFLYWQGNNSEKFYFGDKFTNLSVNENSVVSLIAVYEKDTYVISYNLDGGLNNPENPNNYSVDSGEIVFGKPTRAGYVFVAWYSDPEKTNLIESIPTGSVGNIDIYAKWEANINTLHFNANGGDGVMDDVQVATDVTYYLPKNRFTKRGYEFIGWKTSPDDDIGATFADEATYVMGVESEYTLYAVWEKRVYEIQYQTNGGVNDSTNPISYTIDSPTLELKTATRDGYTFVSWCNDSSLTQLISEIPSGNTGNIILYAKWSANENTLHFNPNGGEGSMEDQKIKTGETAQLRQNLFSKSGSRFAGWGYAPSGSSVYEEKAAYTMGPQSDYTLYAIWTQTAYTIQYNLNGGINSTANPSGYNSEGGAIVLAEPSKTGNTFGGWYKNSSFTSDSRITQINTGDTGNLVLYAKWIKNQYKVTFDYNGGSGSPASKDVTYSETYGALPNANRTGYTFTGWYYNNNRIYDSTEVIIASAHTLKAGWSKNSYILYIEENHVDITVIRNDTGAEVQTGASIPYNTSLTISFTTNSGYHDGWCDYSNQTINMPAENLTIHSGATQDSTCVAKGTLIKTAYGKDVPIEKLNVGDLILSWDYRTKSWIATPITLLVYHGDSLTDIITLEFSNGKTIKVVDSHEFYDVSKQAYVLIGLYNFSDFIGDAFVCYNESDGSLDTVRLINAYKSQEYTGAYTIVSSQFYNCITNDIISATPNIPGIYELISSYLDEELNFNVQALQKDIEEYGLYEYDLFAECLSPEQYSGLCAAYFKIAAGKGYTSFEEIYYLMMMFSYVYY